MDNKITICGIERFVRPVTMTEMKKAVRLASKEKFADEVGYTLRTWTNLLKVCTRPALKTEEINNFSPEEMDKLIVMTKDVTLNRYPLLRPLFKAIELKCTENPTLIRMAARPVSEGVE